MKIICAGTMKYFDKHRSFLILKLIPNFIPILISTLVYLPSNDGSTLKNVTRAHFGLVGKESKNMTAETIK